MTVDLANLAHLPKNPFELIQAYVASGIFPGASFALVSGNSADKYVVGAASIKPERVPLAEDMAYDLASVSKVVGTGTLMIDLILSGDLALDGRLTDYDPEFKGSGGQDLTLRQLLTHTSGIDPYIPNRNQLNYNQLRHALNHVTVTGDKSFHYSDVNFILLGFMIEAYFGQPLSDSLAQTVFASFKMTQTGFVAPSHTVPTAWNLPKGQVHDPKAQVLGSHTGSAGLFSTLDDLIAFCQAYFARPAYLKLLQDYGHADKPRSLAWDLITSSETHETADQWLLHTGYTGTFILINLIRQQAVIFLSNRVHLKDDRQKWIQDRDVLIQAFLSYMKITENP